MEDQVSRFWKFKSLGVQEQHEQEQIQRQGSNDSFMDSQIFQNTSHDVEIIVVSKVAHAHRPVHCAGRPKDVSLTLVFRSAVDRVPRSPSLSSGRIQRWYALIPSARQYDSKCPLCARTPEWIERWEARCPDCHTENAV